MLDNRAEFFFHLLALNALGISAVPISSGLGIDDAAYLLEHSDACLLVTAAQHAQWSTAVVASNGRRVPMITEPDIAQLRPSSKEPESGIPRSGSEAALVYTSGTTGKPKGCILSNDYFLRLGHWYNGLDGFCKLEPGIERLITPLPLNHMNALACSSMAMMMSGGCLIQLDRFHPRDWWQTVRESRATALHYLGVMPAMLLNAPPTGQDDFSTQIKFGFGAGADPRHQERFEQRFGFKLLEAWAMTETGAGACTIVNSEPRRIGTRCIGGMSTPTDYRLIDESGAVVPAGTPGELLVRAKGDDPGRGFFSAYYKDKPATENAWADGWFHTGDVVREDSDGLLYFVDRRKNIIRRSGENIAAVEVEGVLYRHPAVAACAVAPVADEIRGEEVMACVVVDGNHQPDESKARDIAAFAGETLAYFKVPAYVAFVEELPMTASQKIQRGEVKTLCRELLDGDGVFDLRALKRRGGACRGDKDR